MAEALFDYWADYPPLHEMVAAYLRVKPRTGKGASKREMSAEEQNAQTAAFLGLLGGSVLIDPAVRESLAQGPAPSLDKG